MDTNFVFPRPQVAIPRPQKTEPSASTAQGDSPSRDSNALRDSVLETALELGIGRNSTVTRWMFNNAVTEEDEEDDEPQTSPGLTSGSTATSESSHASGDIIYSTPRAAMPNNNFGGYLSTGNAAGPFMVSNKPQPSGGGPDASVWSPASTSTVTFSTAHPDPVPELPASSSRNKLKKKRNPDGYESDGGYVSDSARKRKEKEKKKKEGSDDVTDKARKEREKDEKKRMKEELKAAERMRKKSATARDAPKFEDLKNSGYETDGPSSRRAKSKKAAKKAPSGDGYDTDDGYVSSSGKKKKGFFKRSNKKGSDLTHEDVPSRTSHDPPTLPPMPLPIAGRFASSQTDSTPTSSLYDESPRGVLPPSRILAMEASEGSRSSTQSPAPTFFFDDDTESMTSVSRSQQGTPLPHPVHIQSASDPSSYGQSGSSQISMPFGRPDKPNVPKHVPSPLALQSYSDDGHLNVESSEAPPSKQPYPINTRVPDSARLMPNSGGQISPHPGTPRASPNYPTFSPGQIVNQNAFSPNARHLSQLTIVPSTDYIVPSPQASPAYLQAGLPSPSRVHLNDIPPPSPPPSGPLPARPQDALVPGHSPLSHKPSTESLSPSNGEGTQRGRTSPFPTRPVVLQNTSTPSSLGFEERIKIPRYRELYAMPSPVGGWGSQVTRGESGGVRWKHESDRAMEIDVEVPSEDEADVDELRGALMGRFENPASDEEASSFQGEAALGRSHSFNLRQAGSRSYSPTSDVDEPFAGPGRVRFADDPDTSRDTEYSDGIVGMYADDDTTGGLSARWSESAYTRESVYSRSSFVDDEKSENLRGQLVNRIGTLYDQNGREAGRQNISSRPPIEKF